MSDAFPCATTEAERRDSARSRVFMWVDVHDGQGPVWAEDIGLGGMMVRAKSPRLPGTFVDLEFSLPGDEQRYKVGAQVTCIYPAPNREMALGLRFCLLSRPLQMAIYRLLDTRRGLWDDAFQGKAEPAQLPDEPQDTFKDMLHEAFTDLRTRETTHPGFNVRGPSRDLYTLSRILGNGSDRIAS